MSNDPKSFQSLLDLPLVKIDGSDKAKFFSFFEKTLNFAHKKSKGEWSMGVESADWIRDKNALAYDFYDEKSKQPVLTVLMEESADSIWIEVLKG